LAVVEEAEEVSRGDSQRDDPHRDVDSHVDDLPVTELVLETLGMIVL
jgi:hypothetical protein